jgi:hypothetical protein
VPYGVGNAERKQRVAYHHRHQKEGVDTVLLRRQVTRKQGHQKKGEPLAEKSEPDVEYKMSEKAHRWQYFHEKRNPYSAI